MWSYHLINLSMTSYNLNYRFKNPDPPSSTFHLLPDPEDFDLRLPLFTVLLLMKYLLDTRRETSLCLTTSRISLAYKLNHTRLTRTFHRGHNHRPRRYLEAGISCTGPHRQFRRGRNQLISLVSRPSWMRRKTYEASRGNTRELRRAIP